MPIVNRIADQHREITEWRRDFHAHPELLYDVHRTASSVADKLKAFGCDEVVTGIGRTGVVGVIRGQKGKSDKTIGQRIHIGAQPDDARHVPPPYRADHPRSLQDRGTPRSRTQLACIMHEGWRV